MSNKSYNPRNKTWSPQGGPLGSPSFFDPSVRDRNPPPQDLYYHKVVERQPQDLVHDETSQKSSKFLGWYRWIIAKLLGSPSRRVAGPVRQIRNSAKSRA